VHGCDDIFHVLIGLLATWIFTFLFPSLLITFTNHEKVCDLLVSVMCWRVQGHEFEPCYRLRGIMFSLNLFSLS